MTASESDTSPDSTRPVPGALDGVRVLDLSRILAGPTCTQLLGDLGADVIKVENPSSGGDDTRSWGPPYIAEGENGGGGLSAYFASANRNKRSVAVDLSTASGREYVRRLAAECDVLVENFRPGSLAAHGLDHETILEESPHVVYCSISGFGHSGPNTSKPGYDLLAQGFGGIMSLTGEVGGPPMKVGVGVADVMCGMYAAVGILAALRHRDMTGRGQHIDLALVDSQISWLVNEGANFLASGINPARQGNAHPNIVPYQTYEVRDGYVIVAVGNDGQFARLCDFLEVPELAGDDRFATNPARVVNRSALNAVLIPLFAALEQQNVMDGLEARLVSVGAVNSVAEVFATDQVAAREMVISMHSASADTDMRLIGNPLKLSETPVSYRRPPPTFDEHSDEAEFLRRASSSEGWPTR